MNAPRALGALALSLVVLATGRVAPASEPAAAAGDPARSNLAVMAFTATNAPAGEAEVISGFVREAFVRSRVYVVVEKANMDAILREQAFQQTGCTSADCAIKLGKVLNVHKIVVGNYAMIEGTRFLSGSLVDVETGKIERAARVKGFEVLGIDAAADDLVHRLTSDVVEEAATAPAVPPADIAPARPPLRTRVGLGLNYPGAGVRLCLGDRFALEGRGQWQPEAWAAGCRGYWSVFTLGRLVLSGAGELDGARFARAGFRSGGAVMAAFAVGEYFFTPRFSAQLELGPALVALSGSEGRVSRSLTTARLVTGFGLTWYFGSAAE